jgi:hypothetical protein
MFVAAWLQNRPIASNKLADLPSEWLRISARAYLDASIDRMAFLSGGTVIRMQSPPPALVHPALPETMYTPV